ncbi:MAG: hypothetical protein AAFZ87_11915 [Planctomycetota bacterium]
MEGAKKQAGKTLAERLPGERVPSVGRGAVARMLLVAALLTLALNYVAVRLSPPAKRSFDGMVVERKWQLAGTSDAEIVVVGDSSGNFGADAAVLGSELGADAVNLCTYGRFQIRGAAWMLERVLDARERPPALVLVVLGARTFALSPDGFTFAQLPLGPLAFRGGSLAPALPARHALQFVAARALPLFAQSTSYGRALRTGEWEPDLSRLAIEDDGTARIPAANPRAVPRFADRTIAEYGAVEGDVPSSAERAAARALVRAADERGFDLVFATSPIWEEMATRPEHVAFEGRVRAFLEEACAVTERARVLPGDAPRFSADELENPFHVTPDAAGTYSKEVARRLRALGLPRAAR